MYFSLGASLFLTSFVFLVKPRLCGKENEKDDSLKSNSSFCKEYLPTPHHKSIGDMFPPASA
jgi:hypothetical protein